MPMPILLHGNGRSNDRNHMTKDATSVGGRRLGRRHRLSVLEHTVCTVLRSRFISEPSGAHNLTPTKQSCLWPPFFRYRRSFTLILLITCGTLSGDCTVIVSSDFDRGDWRNKAQGTAVSGSIGSVTDPTAPTKSHSTNNFFHCFSRIL